MKRLSDGELREVLTSAGHSMEWCRHSARDALAYRRALRKIAAYVGTEPPMGWQPYTVEQIALRALGKKEKR